MTQDRPYDVFLSHAHADAAWVERLAAKLADDAGMSVWLDKWVLVPGALWQSEMAQGLDEARCCVVCIGTRTPCSWCDLETGRALNRQVREPDLRVPPCCCPS